MLEGIAARLRMQTIKSLAQDSMTIQQQENMVYESVIVLHHYIHSKKCPHLKMNTTLVVYPLYQKIHNCGKVHDFFHVLVLFCLVFLLSRDLGPCKIILFKLAKQKNKRGKGRTVRKIEIFVKKSSILTRNVDYQNENEMTQKQKC